MQKIFSPLEASSLPRPAPALPLLAREPVWCGVDAARRASRASAKVSSAASNLFEPLNSKKTVFLLFFLLFRFRRFPPVVFRHGRVESLTQDHLDCITGFADHFRSNFQLRFLHRPQHIFFAAAQRMIRPATQPQPRKFLRPDCTDHRLRAVMASRASVPANPNAA